MAATIDWKEEIVKLVYIKQILSDVDKSRLYPHHLPKVAATLNDVKNCENRLGFSLEPDYVDFLLCANGWDGFLQDTDLFGTDDFTGTKRYQTAQTLLDTYDDPPLENIGPARSDIFPIGFSHESPSVYAMVKLGVQSSTRVFWIHGSEIERFSSFIEFFLSMMDYNRLAIEIERKAQSAHQA